ncbi:MAG TPA: glycosyltransferase family 39 protein, partial [Burkholderiales bacterium]|nr:glycosyltransferase family 39 protein [Burkholderiales bacterium]
MVARLLLALLVAVWFASLALRPLYKPDEARYAEISREMMQTGDWVTPRLNGFKYFEKPPLQYWATATAFRLFGTSDWSARLWTGLMALAGVAIAFAAGKRLFGAPAGTVAAALLAASPLYLLYGEFTTLDMGVSVFLAAAIFTFAIAQHRAERHRRGWMLAGWALCALAVLSKGLIGIVLPAATVALYVLVRREWKLLGRLELVRGGALFLAIAAPWFVAVSLANTEFAHFFFVQEHWLRYTTAMHQRSHPVWYFVPVLAIGIAPWLFAAFAALRSALRPAPREDFSSPLFLAIWCTVVFVFFSASGSKLPGYILPLVPALAVLTAGALARSATTALMRAQSVLLVVLGLAIAAGTFYLARLDSSRIEFADAYSPILVTVGLVMAAASGVAANRASRGRLLQCVGALALGTYVAMVVGTVGHRVYAPSFSAAATIAELNPPPSPDARVFAVDTYDHTVPWSLRRT